VRSIAQFFILVIFSASIFFEAGCKQKDAGIPSRIAIDAVSLNLDPANGNTIHQIKGVQVFANQELIGNFELPCKIPIDKLGNVQIDIFPLVLINGSSSNLTLYTPLEGYRDTLNLVAGKTLTVLPTFTHRKSTVVRWIEDFEDNNSTLVPISPSPFPGDTLGIVSRDFDLNGAFKGKSNVYRFCFEDIDSAKYFDVGSFLEYADLPTNGSGVFFEFDIKTDLPVQLALRRKTPTASELVPYMVVNPTGGQWKRFYVNLVYELANQPANTSIRIFFDVNKPANSVAGREILFDNLRLSYLK
jgi:hypothetical protein